jgi:hypothetical protein
MGGGFGLGAGGTDGASLTADAGPCQEAGGCEPADTDEERGPLGVTERDGRWAAKVGPYDDQGHGR